MERGKSSPLRFSGRSPEPLGRIVIPDRAERVVQLSGDERYYGGESPEFRTYVVSRRRRPARAASGRYGKIGRLGKAGEIRETREARGAKNDGKRAKSAKSAKTSSPEADDPHRARIQVNNSSPKS